MKKFFLSMDSGAFTLYTQEAYKKLQSQWGDQYWKGPKFKKFLHRYIEFLNEHKSKLFMYLALDVIHDAKATRQVQKYMESNGLNPIPIFHTKSDIKVFKRLVDNYDYIAVGGLAAKRDRFNYEAFGNSIFDVVIDKAGVPHTKLHGLAMTGRFATRWPWYSMDSVAWRYQAGVGTVQLPMGASRGGFDFSKRKYLVLTDRRVQDPKHYKQLSPLHQAYIRHWFSSIDANLTMAMSDKNPESYWERSYMNCVIFYKHVDWYKQQLLERYGFDGANMMLAMSGRFTDPSLWPLIKRLVASPHIPGHVHLLDSFYYTQLDRPDKQKFWRVIKETTNGNQSGRVTRDPKDSKGRHSSVSTSSDSGPFLL